MAGRPSPIDVIVAHRPNGDPITVADRIVDSLRVGSFRQEAIASAGVGKETVYGWLRTAGRLRLRARGKAVTGLTPKPTAHELRCLAFSDAVDEAEATWTVGTLASLERSARGGHQVVTVTEKQDPQQRNPDGTPLVLERTVRTMTLPPNPQVQEWRLAQRYPEQYGKRVALTGVEGGPVAISVEDRRAELARTLEAYLQGADDEKRATRKPRSNGSNGAGVPGSA